MILGILTLENGADRLSRKVHKELHCAPSNSPEVCSSHVEASFTSNVNQGIGNTQLAAFETAD